jgi:hypothetical protein
VNPVANIVMRLLTNCLMCGRAFKAILKKDREDFGGEDNPAVNNDYTGSDLQVLVDTSSDAVWSGNNHTNTNI